MAATKLERLIVEEISGVTEPANEAPGWIVLKGKEAEVEAVLQEAEAIEKSHTALLEALQGSMEYLKGAPDTVLSAAETLVKFVEDQLGSGETEKSEGGEQPYSIVQRTLARIREIMKNGKDEVDMTQDELKDALDERDAALTKSFEEKLAEGLAAAAQSIGESVAKAIEDAKPEEPAAETPAEEPEAEDTDGDALSLDGVAKAVESLAETVQALVAGTAVRKSIDGQEDEEMFKGEDGKPSLAGAINSALHGKPVTLR